MSPLDAVLVLAIAAFVALFVFAMTRYLPRLRVTPTLRGGVRRGTLVVVIENHGPRAAIGARLTIERVTDRGRALVDGIDLPRVDGNDATTVEVRDLARDGGDEEWRAIRVTLRARNAWPARATLKLQARAATATSAPAPVTYAKVDACPSSPDGKHRMDDRAFANDGVVETWRVCRLCRHVERVPLSPADQAKQDAARTERLAQERLRIEREFERNERDDGRRGQGAGRTRRGTDDDASADGDRLPVEVALHILGLEQKDVTRAKVEEAYKRLAREYHPDRSPTADEKARAILGERMRDLNRARDRLREVLPRES